MADRDPKTGRFLEGNKASPGRPPKLVEDVLLKETIEQVRKERKAIVTALLSQVKNQGNVQAARLLYEYAVGKPPTILELRADEAALLRDVREALESRGINFVETLQAMLEEAALMGEGEDDEH